MQHPVFVPHGAPDLPLSDIPAAQFLRDFFTHRTRPAGIVMISAHWQSATLQLTTAPQLDTIYDFGGFGTELHQLRYPAQTTPWLIQTTKQALSSNAIEVDENPTRGLDHGAWVPLLLMLPEAKIPVVQLSLPRRASPQELFEIGQSLSALAAQDILVIGSGATTHNLRSLMPEGSPTPQWATGFEAWLDQCLRNKDWAELFQFHSTNLGHISHPTTEHLLPLMVIAGLSAALPNGSLQKQHASFSYGSIGMAAWEVQSAT